MVKNCYRLDKLSQDPSTELPTTNTADIVEETLRFKIDR